MTGPDARGLDPHTALTNGAAGVTLAAGGAPTPAPAPPPAPAPSAAQRLWRGVLRRCAPVLRPLGARLRLFMNAPVHAQLEAVRAEHADALRQVHAALAARSEHKLAQLQDQLAAAHAATLAQQQMLFQGTLHAIEASGEQLLAAAGVPANAPAARIEHRHHGAGMQSEIIIVGAGGHAKVCIELLQAMGHKAAYCIGAPDSPSHCLGVPVLIGDDNLARLREEGYGRVFIALGANKLRERLGQNARALGFELVNAISPRAVVSPSARIGAGVAIMAGAVVNADAEIGDFAIVNTGASVDHDCRIGAGVHLAPQCALAGNVVVGHASFLGVGSKVIPEVRIGNFAMVGAGAVVIADVADGTTVVGVPARTVNK